MLFGCDNGNDNGNDKRDDNGNVNISDANFKIYLVGNTAINTNGDSEIQVSEASTFNGVINCNSMNISNLKGIEAFTALTKLDCSDNQLTSLDVSKNTALTELSCYDNKLTSLNISGASALNSLGCWNNQLTSLDVSKNNALSTLHCDDNQFNCDALKSKYGIIDEIFGE